MVKVIQEGSVEDQIDKIEKMFLAHTTAINAIRKMIEELEIKLEEKKVEPEKFEWPDERFETMFATIVSERAEECSPLECEDCQYNIHDNEDGIGHDSCEGGILVSLAKDFIQLEK